MKMLSRLLLFLLVGFLSYQGVKYVLDRHDGHAHYGEPDYSSWQSDASGYAAAKARQRQEGGPMLLYFYADWCGYCKRLGREVFSAPEVERYLKDVNKVRINPEHGDAEQALSVQYHVTGYPTLLLVGGESQPIRPIIPFYQARDGHVHAIRPEAFLRELSGG